MKELLHAPGTLIGMVHLGALPGAPFQRAGLDEVVEESVREARLLVEAGFEVLLLENMGDRPYLRRDAGPHVTAAMTRAALALRAELPEVPLGVQVLAGANRAALAIAHAADAQFVRVEGFSYGALADEGWLDADAGELLRYRRAIGAEDVRILADVQKKHSAHSVTADLSLEALVEGALFCGADGVVVTGESTGRPTAAADVARAREAAGGAPVLVGSGVTTANVGALLPSAAGLIVGSAIKRGGHWSGPVDPERARALCAAVRAAREEGGS